ncbi:MAG: hypothetical protein Q7T38_03125 [Gallionella sp.]|nr:hypothetical protein [Gallionella sp.]
MKITKLTLSLMVVIGTGCTTVPPAPPVSMSDLPNCFNTNYDKERGLFTMKNAVGDPVNQQCLLTVRSRKGVASASVLTAGRYRVYLANGGGGGAGGSAQVSTSSGGGGGGGGAGAAEIQATINLTEGVYKLTIGAGGPGGTACVPGAGFGGGPGWVGSPSNMVRVATGEVLIGAPGADIYARPSRAQNEQMAGKMDAHGGSGPGQASGGHGDRPASTYKIEDEATSGASKQASPGASKLVSGRLVAGGGAGSVSVDDKSSGTSGGEGGGGGATRIGAGGEGGGESAGQKDVAPEHGTLGSGGGGGEGSSSACYPGARGGHGYISLRPI